MKKKGLLMAASSFVWHMSTTTDTVLYTITELAKSSFLSRLVYSKLQSGFKRLLLTPFLCCSSTPGQERSPGAQGGSQVAHPGLPTSPTGSFSIQAPQHSLDLRQSSQQNKLNGKSGETDTVSIQQNRSNVSLRVHENYCLAPFLPTLAPQKKRKNNQTSGSPDLLFTVRRLWQPIKINRKLRKEGEKQAGKASDCTVTQNCPSF